jgi:hypothetical protein
MLDFPASPTVGQIYNGTNGVTYRWDGAIWVATGTSAGGSFNAFGLVSAVAPSAMTTLIPLTILSGNEGGWYSTSTGRFTPPAGRYWIYATMTASWTAAVHVVVGLRKNGVAITSNWDTTATNGYYADPACAQIVDANGSDWFDMQGMTQSVNGTISSAQFMAYPISGIQGVQGPSGTAAGVAVPLYLENVTSGTKTGTLWTPADSFPAITTGVQLFTASYTASNAAHRIRVHAGGAAFPVGGSGERFITALYIDNVGVRLQSLWTPGASQDATCELNWEGVRTAGAHTYEVRLITQITTTFSINGPTAGRWGGGTMAWTLTIEELNAP